MTNGEGLSEIAEAAVAQGQVPGVVAAMSSGPEPWPVVAAAGEREPVVVRSA